MVFVHQHVLLLINEITKVLVICATMQLVTVIYAMNREMNATLVVVDISYYQLMYVHLLVILTIMM